MLRLLDKVLTWLFPSEPPDDDLMAIAKATGVYVESSIDQPIPFAPTGKQPSIEFECEPLHPALYGWLSDSALEQGVAYCWKTS